MGHRLRYTYFPKQELKFSHPENMFLSFYLDGWSVPRRALGRYEVLTLPTASGRSDQSHRLAPVSVTPYTCHPKPKGRVGGQKKPTHSRKGAFTTARPLLAITCLTGETCAKKLRRYLLFRLGLAGGNSTSSVEAQHNYRVKEWVTDYATHIFPSKN